MSAVSTNTETSQPTLSEKARRLLAAHDREVSQLTREVARDNTGPIYRMAG